MARQIERLTPLAVSRAKKPGLYPDGGGLYLRVAYPVKKAGTEGGTRSWMLRYTLNSKQRYLGLGAYPDFSLSDARQRARDARKLLADGKDPIAEKAAQRAAAIAEAAKRITFKEAAAAYIADKRPEWRSGKHSDQWENTLAEYAYPVIGNLPVSEIDTGLITKILRPIWKTKTTTASRLRGRIEAVLKWAKAQGHRTGDNPAAWRGHLEGILASPNKVHKTTHYSALPYAEIGAFMADLREQDGTAARALEFLILTATRTSEAIGARWSEIDLTAKIWTIPADRIKAGKEHRVPLSKPAVALLTAAQKLAPRGAEFVFPGRKPGTALSNGALLMLLERMKRGDLTAHGFRSCFRDWVAEQTDAGQHVAEMALAHAIGNKVEAAYRRGDLLERRTKLMEQWAVHCGRSHGGTVVPMQRGKAGAQ